LKVIWDANDSSETRYYGESAFHQAGNFSGIAKRIEPRIIGSILADLEFEINPDLRTEEIDFVFDDVDKEITQKFQTFGSGVRCELHFYYPDVQGTHEAWFGQLQAPEVWGWKKLEVVATNGSRSRELLTPNSMRPLNHCRFTFGGELPDVESIASNGCPYAKQFGGLGEFKTGSTPYSSCPKSEAACNARFGTTDAKYYGAYDTNVGPYYSNPRTGYIAHADGNASNLTDPVRKVYGSKMVRKLNLMLWSRDEGSSNPNTRWLDTMWEVSEGRIVSMSNIKINEDLVQMIHTAVRLGYIGQPRSLFPGNPGDEVSNFSGLAHFSNRFQCNPRDFSPSNLSAEAFVVGMAGVPQFTNAVPGTGLAATYYSDDAWTDEVHQSNIYNVNYAESLFPPSDGIIGIAEFSFIFEGTITFPTTETVTFHAAHLGGVQVFVNNLVTPIINKLGVDGTDDTGSFAATAGIPYDFKLKFATYSGLSTPWKCILSWSSATITPTVVVPNNALGHEGINAVFRNWTDDRVWCLLDVMTDQKTGMKYPFSRFNPSNWKAASNFLAQYASYSHTHPDGETDTYTGQRSTFNVVMEGRPCDEVITDVCRAGGISVPFQHEGLFEIRPFRAATDDELDDARVFTDTGELQNIVWDDGQPTIKLESVPNDKVINEIECRFENADNADTEEPFLIDNVAQKRLAGRALGDDQLHTVDTRLSAFGIRYLQEAVRFAYRILMFGEFDEGGTENNLRATFTTIYEQAVDLKRYEIIQIDSALLDGHTIGTDNGYTDNTETPQYFRIIELQKVSNGRLEVTAQAYNHTAYEQFEASTINPGGDPGTSELFEAEDATLTGSTAILASGSASGGNYVEMQDATADALFDISSLAIPDGEGTARTLVTIYYRAVDFADVLITVGLNSFVRTLNPTSGGDWSTREINVSGHFSSVEIASETAVTFDLDAISAERFWVPVIIDPDPGPEPPHTPPNLPPTQIPTRSDDASFGAVSYDDTNKYISVEVTT
jgi:hypothetical protein